MNNTEDKAKGSNVSLQIFKDGEWTQLSCETDLNNQTLKEEDLIFSNLNELRFSGVLEKGIENKKDINDRYYITAVDASSIFQRGGKHTLSGEIEDKPTGLFDMIIKLHNGWILNYYAVPKEVVQLILDKQNSKESLCIPVS